MILSYSGWKTYQACQRKWLFSSAIKTTNTKDEFRKEVGILSRLQSIDAWRGEIVDYTISDFFIRGLNKDIVYSREATIDFANKICRKRYDFAKAKKYWDDGIVKNKYKDEYSALFNFEFGIPISSDDFKRVWGEIETSLNNFFDNEELMELLEDEDNKLIPQRNLYIELEGYKIKGIPDLIILNENYPPHIIDWKVHFSGNKTYNEQLLIYALALSQSNHKDFPDYFKNYEVLDYQLTEYQLLINEVRNYPVTEDDLEEIETFLTEEAYQLYLAGGHAKYGKLQIEDFEYAANPENCLTCPYHKICCYDK